MLFQTINIQCWQINHNKLQKFLITDTVPVYCVHYYIACSLQFLYEVIRNILKDQCFGTKMTFKSLILSKTVY